MIEWSRSFNYFRRQAPDNADAVYRLIDEFKLKYRCTEDPHYSSLFTCSEEDFLLIKLTCPEVIFTLDIGNYI
jgi:hypothetical protein